MDERLNWKKLGRVFQADGRHSWMHSYAYVPTAVRLHRERIRVFLAFRDRENVGRIGWIDVAAQDPTRVIAVSEKPSLDIGKPGAFDDNGVTPVTAMQDGDALRLYYAGWQLTPRARYLLFTGLAISRDEGETFIRYQDTPVLDRSPAEWLVRTGAHVMHENGVWKIWYSAASNLVTTGDRLTYTSHLAYAESSDGVSWPQRGIVSMQPREPDEYGFGRPAIVNDGGLYRMWHSIRTHSQGYRIGYATSSDGVVWDRRDDEGGLPASAEGWDSEMTCFASVVDTENGRYMFYNGNDFGRTGVGVARLDISGSRS